jgi:tetratricopeptide (TPR) repeat protein
MIARFGDKDMSFRSVKYLLGGVSVWILACSAMAAAQTGNSFRDITIVSEPKAIVWVDGIRFGRTNDQGRLEMKTGLTGPRTLRVRADGFKEKTQPLAPTQKGEIKVALIKTDDAAELAFQEAERLAGEDREKAAEAYRRAIKARPNYPEAYLNLSRVLLESQNLDEAKRALVAAKRLRPGYAEASAVEGRIHKENGEETKAITAFKQAITDGKGFQPEAYAGLGLLYKERAEGFGGSGDFTNEALAYAESAKYLQTALKQLSGAPDTIVIYQLLGLIFERQKKYAEAIATYEEFLRLFPNSTDATAVRSFIVQLKKDMAANN